MHDQLREQLRNGSVVQSIACDHFRISWTGLPFSSITHRVPYANTKLQPPLRLCQSFKMFLKSYFNDENTMNWIRARTADNTSHKWRDKWRFAFAAASSLISKSANIDPISFLHHILHMTFRWNHAGHHVQLLWNCYKWFQYFIAPHLTSMNWTLDAIVLRVLCLLFFSWTQWYVVVDE